MLLFLPLGAQINTSNVGSCVISVQRTTVSSTNTCITWYFWWSSCGRTRKHTIIYPWLYFTFYLGFISSLVPAAYSSLFGTKGYPFFWATLLRAVLIILLVILQIFSVYQFLLFDFHFPLATVGYLIFLISIAVNACFLQSCEIWGNIHPWQFDGTWKVCFKVPFNIPSYSIFKLFYYLPLDTSKIRMM